MHWIFSVGDKCKNQIHVLEARLGWCERGTLSWDVARYVIVLCQADSLFSSRIVGKTLAFTSIRFYNEREELVARGSHTKYVSLAWKDENNITNVLSPKPPGKMGEKP